MMFVFSLLVNDCFGEGGCCTTEDVGVGAKKWRVDPGVLLAGIQGDDGIVVVMQ